MAKLLSCIRPCSHPTFVLVRRTNDVSCLSPSTPTLNSFCMLRLGAPIQTYRFCRSLLLLMLLLVRASKDWGKVMSFENLWFYWRGLVCVLFSSDSRSPDVRARRDSRDVTQPKETERRIVTLRSRDSDRNDVQSKRRSMSTSSSSRSRSRSRSKGQQRVMPKSDSRGRSRSVSESKRESRESRSRAKQRSRSNKSRSSSRDEGERRRPSSDGKTNAAKGDQATNVSKHILLVVE